MYTYSMQGLTQVEEMLVSAVMLIMSIYQLPHGQYGYSGHVVNLPQDVASFVSSLPRLPSELDVIIVRKEGASQSHWDFRVRRSVVHRALQWLITNNKYYRALNVRIDANALVQLPQDGNLSQLTSVTVESTDTDSLTTSSQSTVTPPTTDATADDSGPYDGHMPLYLLQPSQ